MNKIDYKKEYKSLYTGKKNELNIIEVLKMKYIQINGSGNPNTDISYSRSIEALYSVAYSIKSIYKKKELDFVVMPLEGLWYAKDYSVFNSREKEKWNWTMMIMIPHFVTETEFKNAVDIALAKKGNDKINEIFFKEYDEGLAIQTLHIGSYDEETFIIAEMHKYADENGYKLNGKHHEIYLNDPRKTEEKKLKTIIRQPIIK